MDVTQLEELNKALIPALNLTVSPLDWEFLGGMAIGNITYYRKVKDQPITPRDLYELLASHLMNATDTDLFSTGVIFGFFAAAAGGQPITLLGEETEHAKGLFLPTPSIE